MRFKKCIYDFVVMHKIYYCLQCFNDFYLFEKFALAFFETLCDDDIWKFCDAYNYGSYPWNLWHNG